MSGEDLPEAAKVTESPSGLPPAFGGRRMGRREKQEAARVRRFLALPPQLQEGVLRYAENLKKAYLSRS